MKPKFYYHFWCTELNLADEQLGVQLPILSMFALGALKVDSYLRIRTKLVRPYQTLSPVLPFIPPSGFSVMDVTGYILQRAVTAVSQITSIDNRKHGVGSHQKQTKRCSRRWCVRPLNENRHIKGELFSLVLPMRELDDERHFQYFRMSAARFDELLIILY